jgi:alkylation response protein AidB-like acyl-CoA dehydrogenase
MGAQLVARAGSAEQKQAILPAVVEGRMKLAFAHTEGKQGEKLGVVGAPLADRLVVSSGDRLFLADRADVKLKPYRSMDNMVAADLIFSRDRAEPMPGADQAIEQVTDFATALVCAEAVGAMKFACDTTLEYLKTRRQFGVPIGTFQALQHRMVDMVMSLEQARSMACLAASKADTERAARERARAISAAKIKIADAARHVSQEAVQLHGGMGMSEELKVSHSFRRLTVAAQQFGDVDHHLARFASL